MEILDKNNVTGIAALLVHAAKIDEKYSNKEKNLIKDFIQSKKLERLRNGNSSFYSSIGTTCEVCPSSPVPMWQIKSQTIFRTASHDTLYFYP